MLYLFRNTLFDQSRRHRLLYTIFYKDCNHPQHGDDIEEFLVPAQTFDVMVAEISWPRKNPGRLQGQYDKSTIYDAEQSAFGAFYETDKILSIRHKTKCDYQRISAI